MVVRIWVLLLAVLVLAACAIDSEEAVRSKLARWVWPGEVLDFTSRPTCTAAVFALATPGLRKTVKPVQTVDAGLAYVAVWNSGLEIFDISQPSTPTRIATHPVPGGAIGATVVGDIGYVATWSNGVQVLNVGLPEAPLDLGTLETPGISHRVAVAGNLILVPDFTAGLIN